MKAIPVMKINIDDDPENANWLHQMRNKKKKTKKVLSPKVEEIKQLVMTKLEECSTGKKGISKLITNKLSKRNALIK